MKKSRYIIFSFMLAELCLATSCKKLVEVDAPTNSLVTSSVFNKDVTAIAAQLAVYTKMQGTLYYWEDFTGLSADELTNYSTSQFNIDLYHNTLNAQNDGGANGLWDIAYSGIFQENAILENVSGSTGMSTRVKSLVNGEALFMRAYYYFQLVNMFGDVPLVTSTDYKKNQILSKAQATQIYEQIINDLTNALPLLSASYLDASDNIGTTDRVRPTTWAANALLARVYLYKGDYTDAEKQASLVIANTGMFSLSPLSGATSVFKKNSSEAIWQIMPQTGQLYTTEGSTSILIAPPTNKTLSPQLLAVFEPNDARRTNWVGTFSSGGTTWNYANKYKDYSTATTLTEYSMVLRLAEEYLIRAETEANGAGAGLSGAINDLNAIRTRAGLPNYSGTVDKPSLLAAIMHERQVELFGENHRWYDLKRTKTVDAAMAVVAPQKSGTWNSYQQFYPLPLASLQLDPNLTQNSGY